MKKDIPEFIVEDVAIAIVLEEEGHPAMPNESSWHVYLINLKDHPIENVLITSNGYGSLEGESRKTSTLRHYFDSLPAQSFAKVEPIISDVFALTNEYWVSFYQDKDIYDKRFIFVAESITRENLINIPLVNKRGVMIR